MSTCIVFFSGFSAENTIKVSLLQNTVFGFSLSNVHMYCIFSWVFWKKIQYIYHLKKIFFFRNLVGQMSTCIVFFLGFLEKNTIKVSLETKLFFFFFLPSFIIFECFFLHFHGENERNGIFQFPPLFHLKSTSKCFSCKKYFFSPFFHCGSFSKKISLIIHF